MRILKEAKKKYLTVGEAKNLILNAFKDLNDSEDIIEFDFYDPENSSIYLDGWGYIDLKNIKTHRLYSKDLIDKINYIVSYEDSIKNTWGWNLGKIFKDAGYTYNPNSSLETQLYDITEIDAGAFVDDLSRRVDTKLRLLQRRARLQK